MQYSVECAIGQSVTSMSVRYLVKIENVLHESNILKNHTVGMVKLKKSLSYIRLKDEFIKMNFLLN